MLEEILVLLQEKGDFFLSLLIEHMQISLISIIIASIIGLILGIIIGEYRKSSKTILGIINFMYTIPSISLLGFLIPFSGIGNSTAIIALSVYALLPMVRNTYTGIINIDENILEAATGMGATRWQILYEIKLPLAFPVIMSGFRNMVTMTIALAGIASFIGAGGLGVAIYRGITTNNTAMTLIGSLLIAILALITDIVLGLIEKLFTVRKAAVKSKRRFGLIAILVVCGSLIGSSIINNVNQVKTLNLATKPMTEQYIIGAMLKEVIEQETDIKVKIIQGVGGGTSNIHPGMISGEFDLYPEYTSTGWNTVLKHQGFYNEDMYEQLVNEYQEKFNFTWTGLLGFSDAYGLAVRKELAQQYNLKTYSDLAKIANQLTFGAEYDFYEIPEGYDALCKKYNLNFKDTMDLDIGLKYQAINEGKVDVIDIFTTDGQLTAANVVVLEDDQQFFSTAMGALVIRNDVLADYLELKDVFEKMTGILDESKMAELNYLVETEGQDAEDVAHNFLVSIGLVE